MQSSTRFLSLAAAVLYAGWGVFHIYVAWQIYELGYAAQGMAQGRLYQLAAYMMTIALFAIVIGLRRIARNDPLGFWLNLIVVGWADAIWVLVVVLPGYVPLLRGLAPPAMYVLAALLSGIAYRATIPVQAPNE